MGRLECPLLLVVGEDDQNWPAHECAMDMKETMERAGNSHLLTVLSYKNAGHLIEPPFMPFARASSFKTVTNPPTKVMALWGGELVAHSRVQEDAWRKMLRQHCVKLSVQPSRGLVDEKFTVLVQNLLPGFQLTIHALHQCEDGHSWEAFAHYTADATSIVNVSQDPSLGGTYSGVEPMGLLWSLRLVPGSKTGLRWRKMNVQTPMGVTISVYHGHQTEGFLDQVLLASVVVERWYMAPGVRRVPITEGRLTATLFLPSGPGPFPGLLDLWGWGGKLVEYRAALLASHGIASLALNYLTPQITKETGKMVDNDYFETAYRVLEQHPQILGSRIAMLGLSLGAAVTLRKAVYSQVVKLRCAVCISGSHVQPIDGPVEQFNALFNKNIDKIHLDKDNQSILRDTLLPIPTDPSLKVDIKHTDKATPGSSSKGQFAANNRAMLRV
ncbi:peroxisomal succinyl-coenzyme A thioesterase-like [Trematomus bernacchii]|uniref:peroxisomal succinyl-coenzyme A thioesterase-like n=1 Tax=Trematomus bernacchii TaxID=40690 RepID=UPI001469F7D5|nr:peroxisomal succinyl-coenzyme A thioesterase-like [Trematomus bernacchii]